MLTRIVIMSLVLILFVGFIVQADTKIFLTLSGWDINSLAILLATRSSIVHVGLLVDGVAIEAGGAIWEGLPKKNGLAFYYFCQRVGDEVRCRSLGGHIDVAVRSRSDK